ncbi:unnamed protein product [Laminaria digitata]
MSRCQCGEVVMELTGRPIASINCHCNICQNWSGAPYLWMVLFLSENVDVVKGKGNLTVTQTTDAVDRARCKSCTSHVYNSSKGGKMFVVPGVYIQGIRNEDRTFAKGFAPSAEIFYGERVSVRLLFQKNKFAPYKFPPSCPPFVCFCALYGAVFCTVVTRFRFPVFAYGFSASGVSLSCP